MKITKEIKVAILVLSGIALFIYMFTYLKGEDLFSSADTYYTQFDFKALSPSAAVTIKGNKIGKVEAIIYDDKTGKTNVEFSVNPEVKFSKFSTIRLYETGLMGGNALAIIKKDGAILAKSGDTLQSEIKPGLVSALEKDFSNISDDLGSTIKTADTLMTNLNAMVVDNSDAGIKRTIAELNATLKSFKSLSNSVQAVIKTNDEKIAIILENFEKTSRDLSELTNDIKDVKLSETITNLNQTLTSVKDVMAKLDNKDGTVGKLLNDDALYNNLEAASKEMELLLLDIKLHPARYRRILSKKEIPYQAPTEDQRN